MVTEIFKLLSFLEKIFTIVKLLALVCQKSSVRYQGEARVKARAKELDN